MNDDLINKKLGSKIIYLRKAKSYSQEKFAEKVNISTIYMSEIERGEANPTLEKLKNIADSLEVELVELFNFSF